jgi:hypothetical protein
MWQKYTIPYKLVIRQAINSDEISCVINYFYWPKPSKYIILMKLTKNSCKINSCRLGAFHYSHINALVHGLTNYSLDLNQFI